MPFHRVSLHVFILNLHDDIIGNVLLLYGRSDLVALKRPLFPKDKIRSRIDLPFIYNLTFFCEFSRFPMYRYTFEHFVELQGQTKEIGKFKITPIRTVKQKC